MCGARIWDLVNKGEIFEDLVQIDKVMEIGDRLLGNSFNVSSYSISYAKAGMIGQIPHIDYPYYDFDNGQGQGSGEWPNTPKNNANHTYFMNLQVAIQVDDATLTNGCLELLPYSQREISWPDKQYFDKNKWLIPLKKGSLVIMTGCIHHAAGHNNSQDDRTTVLIQYLPKFIRPMEIMYLDDNVKEKANHCRSLSILG